MALRNKRKGRGGLFFKILFCVGYNFAEWFMDTFLEMLLYGMAFAFFLSRSYRNDNIIKGFEKKEFNAKYLFTSADNKVAAAAIFSNKKMRVKEDAITNWDARVTFKSVAAFRKFLFSEDQDVLDSILANEVKIDGNLNLIFKFSFMVRDLQHRVGVAI
jgi:hypothetical protein